MPPDGGMSPGELQRRIADLASTTLRRDVYDADERRRDAERQADRSALRDLEGDVEQMQDQARTNRRLIITGLVYPVLVGAIMLILTVWLNR